MPKSHSLLHLEAAGGVFDDPGVLVSPANLPYSLLFDAGNLQGLKIRQLQRVKWLFVTHFHIDHIIGFDHLLRVRLFSDLPLTVFGPPGTSRIIASRLQGYAWNLTSGSPFVLRTVELVADEQLAVTNFACHRCFEPEPVELPDDLEIVSPRQVSLAKHLSIRWHPVNHGVPCMAYRFNHSSPPKFSHQESSRLGLQPGPWIRTLVESQENLQVQVGETLRDRDWLSQHLLEDVPDQSLGYLTDTALDQELTERLSEFFFEVSTLCSETAYLNSEAELARVNLHMTCSQVAQLATASRAKRLKIFHLSRRHIEAGPQPHLEEVRQGFPDAELLSDK